MKSVKSLIWVLSLMLCIGAITGCDDDQFSSSGLLGPNNPGPNPNPNPNPPGLVTHCVETYDILVDHHNSGATIDRLVSLRWVLGQDVGANLDRTTGSGDPNRCPNSIAPETQDDVLAIAGGRYAGGNQPANPDLHNYISAIALFGYLFLDLGRLEIDTSILTFTQWDFTNDFHERRPFMVGNCSIEIVPSDFSVFPAPAPAQNWQTAGTITFTVTNAQGVQNCGEITNVIPPGPFAGYMPQESVSDEFMDALDAEAAEIFNY